MQTFSRENNFDLIRLFAAAQVVWIHSVAHIGFPKGPMWLYALFNLFPGVAIFFVVSGFLITGSVQKQGASLTGYFFSRALRIYPALWANILGLIALVYWAEQFNGDMPSFWLWGATLFVTGNDYFANVWPLVDPFVHHGFYTNLPPSGVLWTIPIEISFYFLAPVIVGKWLPRKLLPWSLLAWGAISLVAFWSTDRYGYPDQIMKYLWMFLLGAAMRCHWAKIRPIIEGRGLAFAGAYIAAGMALYAARGREYLYWDRDLASVLLTFLLSVTVISLAYTKPKASAILRKNDISYGLYLWHMPVAWTMIGFGLTGVAASVGAWLSAAALAVTSWLLIERPSLRLRGRWSGGFASPQPTSG